MEGAERKSNFESAEFSLKNGKSCPSWTRHEGVTEQRELCGFGQGADVILLCTDTAMPQPSSSIGI